MGVHGLWRLIEPSGKPVPLETLENKILAVDISIWLHQAIKGFQDSRGAPLPNAHLLGIYHRVCKLLYFRIKPIFVFDGGVPALKKQTIAKRNQQKTKLLNDANDIQTKLLKTLLKKSAVNKVISDKISSSQDINDHHKNENTKEDIFKLPELPPSEQLNSTLDSSYSSDYDESSSSSPTKQWDLQTIDEKSEHFRSLPADVRHEILTEIKETRKQSSWHKLHELPSESGEFSFFQMKRLLKRYSVQVSLEEAEKEMGGHSLSLGELEALLNAEGIATSSEPSGRIASNADARYLLIKDMQKAIEKAKKESENEKQKLDTISETSESISPNAANNENMSTDKEFQRDLEAAIKLSMQDQPSTSKETENKHELSYLENFNDGDFDSESESDEEKLSHLKQVKSYMIEYSGLTPNEISKIINEKSKSKISKVTKIKDNKKINHELEMKTILNSDITETNKVIKTKNALANSSVNMKKNIEIEIMSDSDSSFIEVLDKPENINKENKLETKIHEISKQESSDSSDSDFIEVDNQTNQSIPPTNTKPCFEIVINPEENLQDDIFNDIFEEEKTENKMEKEEIRLENNEKANTSLTEKQKNTNLETIENVPIVEKFEIYDDKKVSEEINKKEEPEKPRLTVEELNNMKTNLVAEQQQLMTERNTKERMAGNITDQMYQEAQELLELFGVPYIIAPMEAEAQCAFLNEINLTDGTITDDSDIWLFGGKTVYKNFFNHNKHVLECRSDNIEHYFKLSREQLILLALLVGSDYTLGIQGIGPVTALEILAAFPPSKQKNITVLTQNELISGLGEFRRWLSGGRSVGIGRTALRSKLRNVTLSENFPNVQIVQAYLQPKVETCRDKFTWAKPDIVGLIDFAKEKFGWTKLKSDEILKPVMKKLEDKNIQKSIKDYFATKHKINSDLTEYKISKRVKTAVKRMGKSNDDTVIEETKKATKKRATRKTKNNKIENSVKNESNNNGTVTKKEPPTKKVKECIPQRERDKINALKSKLQAIEVFRKSKQGPGYTKKRTKQISQLKEEAELSESSSSD